MNDVSTRKFCLAIAVALLAGAGATGCSEVRGRRRVQEGNRLYKDGQYKDAVAMYKEAEAFVPNLPQLWLNEGYTCRQLIVPGDQKPDSVSKSASDCALKALKRYQEIAPQDSRGEMLYLQTLFDSDHFEELAKMYEGRFNKNPKDIESVNGLIQVYSKWPDHLDDSLSWYNRKAEILSNDPEAQYAVGVFIYTQLMQHGGGPEQQVFDPRPDPNHPKAVKVPPGNARGDIVSQQRVDMADTALKFLEKAVALRPKYHEAMIYANLVYRQRSFAYFGEPAEWQKCVDKAMEWSKRSLEAQGKTAPPPTAAPAPAETPKPEPGMKKPKHGGKGSKAAGPHKANKRGRKR
jgi:tetratricopeptide (TPR) repeat protein